MARYPKNINSIYISERMQENLRYIKESTMTSIVAPMGYGKTTAALWYMEERQKKGDHVFRVNIYSSDVNQFWQSFCNTFRGTELGERLKEMDFPVGKSAIHMLIMDMEEYLRTLEQDMFLLIDDCHLMGDKRVFEMLFSLCDIPTDKLHIIVISRGGLFVHGEELHLGNRLYRITIDDMRLNRTELSVYLRRCGVELPDEEFETLYLNSEGWFSCVYLNICNYERTGTLLSKGEDIYSMIGEALYSGYNEKEKHFLLCMSIADEFTIKQAEFITEESDTKEIIKNLAGNNAFIRYLADTDTYRFHHMLRGYVEQLFRQLSEEGQKNLKLRYGQWHESQAEYIPAMCFYEEIDAMSNVLHVLGLDRGVQLASMDEKRFQTLLSKCTEEDLIRNPLVLLVLMRQLFSRKQIPKMFAMKELFLKATESKELAEEERNNLLGECDLIMSFLGYNDIRAMSALHQKAATLMTRKAISTGNTGSYTFGSPSVLMMFHRESGKLADEVDILNRSMPYYYQITDQSGIGAELVMEAEALYHRGKFIDAKIMLQRAKDRTGTTSQLHLPLCCDFLERRLALFGEADVVDDWYTKKVKGYRKANDPMIFNTLDGCHAYLSVITGQIDHIPEWIGEGKIAEANLLHPARAMFEIIYNQVLLAKKDYVEVIARSEQVMSMCRTYPYMLCEIHLHIQLAIANDGLNKKAEAKDELKKAFDLALPDGIIMPFAENGKMLAGMLSSFEEILEVEEIRQITRKLYGYGEVYLHGLDVLTERERKIVELFVSGRNRKEIAEEMYLAEGTIKNNIRTIYEKLNLNGTAKQKHMQLSQLFADYIKKS